MRGEGAKVQCHREERGDDFKNSRSKIAFEKQSSAKIMGLLKFFT